MLTPNDIKTVYEFLKATGEGNVRKMLTGGQMTAAHVGLLMKVLRGCSEVEFIEHCEKATFPKIRMSPAEMAMRDKFWGIAIERFGAVGLISNKKAA